MALHLSEGHASRLCVTPAADVRLYEVVRVKGGGVAWRLLLLQFPSRDPCQRPAYGEVPPPGGTHYTRSLNKAAALYLSYTGSNSELNSSDRPPVFYNIAWFVFQSIVFDNILSNRLRQ